MQTVAIGRDRVCDALGDEVDPGRFIRNVADDELVVVHDLEANVLRDAIEEAANAVARPDVLVGAWTFVDDQYGVIERRGVLTVERLRWSNTAGTAIVVSGGALRRSGWSVDGHCGLHELMLRLAETDGLRTSSTTAVFARLDGGPRPSPGIHPWRPPQNRLPPVWTFLRLHSRSR